MRESEKIKIPIDKSFVCIEYPGKVNNVEAALLTLGGKEKILKCIRSSSENLVLNFDSDSISQGVSSVSDKKLQLLVKKK
jgi:hypothetical protein